VRSRGWFRVPGAILGAALAIAIVVQIVVGLTQRSWTDAYKFGRVEVPGKTVVHLPAGALDISLRELTAGTVHVPPGLRVTVVPLEGAPVRLTRDVGGSFGPSGRTSSVSYRRVFKATIPRAGAYRVSSGGTTGDGGYAVEFGHAPAAIGGRIWEYAGIAALVALVAWLIGRATGLLRAPAPSPSGTRPT
jgi:hypothetical protein